MVAQARVLILTSRTGGGHISLAQALSDQLEHEYSCEIVDPQPTFFHLHYRLVSRYALWLWSAEFQQTDTPAKARLAHHLFTPLVARELLALIRRIQPSLIVTTYPFLSYEVLQVLKRVQLDIPFAMLFADPNTVHASWLTERRAQATLAPTQETYDQALKAGFAADRLHLVGWPVRAQFYQVDTDRQHMRRQLKLDPHRFTVFLQGGGEGAARFGETVERVLAISADLQVILATGTNQALLARCRSLPHLAALPFTREIAAYMQAADVIMGKAGPNTLFEAVALGKPFIATAYIPGQEQGNLDFIRRHQLGWIALTSEEQRGLLHTLVAQPEQVQLMQRKVALYGQWNREQNRRLLPLLQALCDDAL